MIASDSKTVLTINRLVEQLVQAIDTMGCHHDPLLNLAAIGLLIKRCQSFLGPPSPQLQVGPLQLDERSRDVTIAGERLDLSRREHELLSYLMRHHDTALSRQQILREVWGEGHVGKENLLDVYIGYVRAKLKAHGCFQGMLETLRGVGYILRTPPGSAGSETQ
jgi:two-component system, OmpR family, response regulator PrrA